MRELKAFWLVVFFEPLKIMDTLGMQMGTICAEILDVSRSHLQIEQPVILNLSRIKVGIMRFVNSITT